MQLIYIHGFDSSPASVKGQLLYDYCQQHHPEICVLRPNLNLPPTDVMSLLSEMIAQNPQTGLVGSSLGGYYAMLCTAKHAVPAVLINPSTRPFDTLPQYVDSRFAADEQSIAPNEVLHTTAYGWQVTRQHFDDLAACYPAAPSYPDKQLVLLKTGDETIDYRLAKVYFTQQGAQSHLIIDQGGDHAMSDFHHKIPLVIQFLCQNTG